MKSTIVFKSLSSLVLTFFSFLVLQSYAEVRSSLDDDTFFVPKETETEELKNGGTEEQKK